MSASKRGHEHERATVVSDRESTGSSGGIGSNLARSTPGFNERRSVSLTRLGPVSSVWPMTPISRFGFLALILSLLAGCETRTASEELLTPIPEDSYVAVMGELANLRRRPPHARGQIERDRLADSVRTEILIRRDVTAAELVEFADVVGSEPGRMQSLTERIESFADSLEVSAVRLDSIQADSVVQSQESDGQDSLPVTDTPAMDTGRGTADSSEARTAERGARFADPDLEVPAVADETVDPAAAEGDSLPATDTLRDVDSMPPTDAAPIRRRPGNSRRPVQRPPPAAAPDSTPGQSNHGATATDTGIG